MITKTRAAYQSTSPHFDLYVSEIWKQPGLEYLFPSYVNDYTNYGNAQSLDNSVLVLNESIQGSNGRGMHACIHDRGAISIASGSYTGIKAGDSSNPPRYTYRFTISNLAALESLATHAVDGRGTGFFQGNLKAFSTSWASDWASKARDAIVSMWPRVSSEVSLPNFLVELKDVRRLYSTFKGVMQRFAKWANRELPTWKVWKNLTVNQRYRRLNRHGKQMVRDWADYELTKEFAIKPFVGDLIGIKDGLQRAKSEAARFILMENKRIKSHFQRKLTPPDSVTTTSQLWISPDLWVLRTRKMEWITALYSATLEYTFELDAWQRANIKTLTLLDTYGINLNPRILWDAMPWSFAIDWLFKVGDFLDQFAIRHVRPIVKVRGFCHSCKATRKISREFSIPSGNAGYTNPTVTSASEMRTNYIRLPHIPEIWTSIRGSGYSLREAVLSGALAIKR